MTLPVYAGAGGQGSQSSGANVTSVATNAFLATSGQTIAVTVRRGGFAGVTITVNDNAGNTYISNATRGEHASVGAFETFRAYNITGDPNLVVTANFSTGVPFVSIAAGAVNDADTADPLGTATTNATPSGSAGATDAFNTGADELVVCGGTVDNLGTFSAGNIGGGAATMRQNNGLIGLETRGFAAAQTGITAAMTFGSSQQWIVGAFSLRGTGGGGGGGVVGRLIGGRLVGRSHLIGGRLVA